MAIKLEKRVSSRKPRDTDLNKGKNLKLAPQRTTLTPQIPPSALRCWALEGQVPTGRQLRSGSNARQLWLTQASVVFRHRYTFREIFNRPLRPNVKPRTAERKLFLGDTT